MKPYKTLLLENDLVVIKRIKKYFDTSTLLDIVDVRSVKQAINVLIEESFDLSILDIALTDGNCFELLDAVPRQKFGEIIFLTKYADDYYPKMLKIRPIDYIPKPFDEASFKTKIMLAHEHLLKKQLPMELLELFELDKAKIKFVAFKDILNVEYEKTTGRVCYHCRELNTDKELKEYRPYLYFKALGTGTLKSQWERLDTRFVQAQKECIINIDFIPSTNIYRDSTQFIFTMENGDVIEVSRMYRDEVLKKKGVRKL